jgi:hypothetical protein
MKTSIPPIRLALILLGALAIDASLLQRASAAQVCAWIVETVEDDGAHKFALNLSADAPISASVRFQAPGVISASMGGELIQLDPGMPMDVDAEGFDVDAGDDLSFDVKLFDHPLSVDEFDAPHGKPLAAFVFHRKVAEGEHAPPADLAVKQCKPLG